LEACPSANLTHHEVGRAVPGVAAPHRRDFCQQLFCLADLRLKYKVVIRSLSGWQIVPTFSCNCTTKGNLGRVDSLMSKHRCVRKSGIPDVLHSQAPATVLHQPSKANSMFTSHVYRSTQPSSASSSLLTSWSRLPAPESVSPPTKGQIRALRTSFDSLRIMRSHRHYV
jgi:hypothetical protein